MDVHKRSTERLEVVETGRRRRWSDDEKLRIVLESLETPRAISSTARRHDISRSLLMTWRRGFRPEPVVRDAQNGFVRAVVATAETIAAEPGAQASGRMVIEIGKDRRIIVDAGVMRPRLGGCSPYGSGDDPGCGRLRIWIASGHTDMRKGMNGLSLLVHEGLGRDPFAGDVFVF